MILLLLLVALLAGPAAAMGVLILYVLLYVLAGLWCSASASAPPQTETPAEFQTRHDSATAAYRAAYQVDLDAVLAAGPDSSLGRAYLRGEWQLGRSGERR